MSQNLARSLTRKEESKERNGFFPSSSFSPHAPGVRETAVLSKDTEMRNERSWNTLTHFRFSKKTRVQKASKFFFLALKLARSLARWLQHILVWLWYSTLPDYSQS